MVFGFAKLSPASFLDQLSLVPSTGSSEWTLVPGETHKKKRAQTNVSKKNAGNPGPGHSFLCPGWRGGLSRMGYGLPGHTSLLSSPPPSPIPNHRWTLSGVVWGQDTVLPPSPPPWWGVGAYFHLWDSPVWSVPATPRHHFRPHPPCHSPTGCPLSHQLMSVS